MKRRVFRSIDLESILELRMAHSLRFKTKAIYTITIRVNTMVHRSIFLSLLFFVHIVFADSEPLWSDVSPDTTAQTRSPAKLSLFPDAYRLKHLDENRMRNELDAASHSLARKSSGSKTKELEIPLPNGKFLSLQVKEIHTMAPELAAKYPQIKTYRAEATDNNGIYGVLDLTEQGFHAMLIMHDGSRLFIDPRKTSDETYYIIYYDKHYHPSGKKPFKCEIESHNHPQQQTDSISYRIAHLYKSAQRSVNQLRTYRLAMAATGEYTAFHGGTVTGALSAMVTTVNRVNAIYERDLAVKLELVANTDLLIRTDTTTYNNADGLTMLGQNQTQIDSLISSVNYDIGHVMSTAGGGFAYIGAVCKNNFKARGVTGQSHPQSDSFDIDYVAHEIGHQFGGNHTFNSTSENCAGNRNSATAFEPGGGTTIMAYANICGINNIQNHSDAMFHVKSIEEIGNFIDNSVLGGSCGLASPLNNQQPISNAGSDYTIPANTPFELTGIGTDPDGDTLSYSWEQVDAGTASDSNVDTSDNAIFRSFLPQTTATRIFPMLNSILNNAEDKGEILPINTRNLNFSLAVRDGKGGVASDQMRITVKGSNTFRITSHNNAGILPGNTLVTWNVANTNSAPISCNNVNILLSTNAGTTFTNISGATPNDGSQNVTIPVNISESTTARFKIKCANNIFFDISDANLTTPSLLNIQPTVLSNTGNNTVADPGETIHLTIPLYNNDPLVATNVRGTLSSTNQDVNIIVAESLYPNIQTASQTNNTTSYLVNIPTNHICGTDIPLTLNSSFTLDTQINKTFNFMIPVGTVTHGSQENSNTQAIPDNPSSGITSQISLSGLGVVAKPKINIDVNISHTYRGDLGVKLTSPQGTTIQLKQGGSADDLDNLTGNFPINFTPEQSLSAFDGENLDGIWTLTVSDLSNEDIGTLNSWTLNYDSIHCEVFTQPDTDNDGFTDNIDNCPNQSNPRQSDEDNNGQGDMCTPYQLLHNKWRQISIPANVTNATVSDVFADALPAAELGTKWALYSYDPSAGIYSTLALTDRLNQGEGYWIIQITGNTVNINLPATAQETSVQLSLQCTSTAGCYEIVLPATASDGQWSILGYPFEHSLNTLNKVRVVTDSGVCGDTDGCTLNEAFNANVYLNILWSYNGTIYDSLTPTSKINSWTGAWGRTLENSSGLEVRLLFPLP